MVGAVASDGWLEMVVVVVVAVVVASAAVGSSGGSESEAGEAVDDMAAIVDEILYTRGAGLASPIRPAARALIGSSTDGGKAGENDTDSSCMAGEGKAGDRAKGKDERRPGDSGTPDNSGECNNVLLDKLNGSNESFLPRNSTTYDDGGDAPNTGTVPGDTCISGVDGSGVVRWKVVEAARSSVSCALSSGGVGSGGMGGFAAIEAVAVAVGCSAASLTTAFSSFTLTVLNLLVVFFTAPPSPSPSGSVLLPVSLATSSSSSASPISSSSSLSLSSGLSPCVRMCLLQLLRSVNCRGHCGHLYGFSPVCVLI